MPAKTPTTKPGISRSCWWSWSAWSQRTQGKYARKYIGRWGLGVLRIGDFRGVIEAWGNSLSKRVVSKLYGVNATIIIFVFVLYCIVRVVFIIVLKGYFVLN